MKEGFYELLVSDGVIDTISYDMRLSDISLKG